MVADVTCSKPSLSDECDEEGTKYLRRIFGNSENALK